MAGLHTPGQIVCPCLSASASSRRSWKLPEAFTKQSTPVRGPRRTDETHQRRQRVSAAPALCCFATFPEMPEDPSVAIVPRSDPAPGIAARASAPVRARSCYHHLDYAPLVVQRWLPLRPELLVHRGGLRSKHGIEPRDFLVRLRDHCLRGAQLDGVRRGVAVAIAQPLSQNNRRVRYYAAYTYRLRRRRPRFRTSPDGAAPSRCSGGVLRADSDCGAVCFVAAVLPTLFSLDRARSVVCRARCSASRSAIGFSSFVAGFAL